MFNGVSQRTSIGAINVATGTVVDLTADLGRDFWTPDWSPDGQHIVAQGTSAITDPASGLTIFDVSCDATTCARTGARTLLSSSAADMFDPAYAPDGTKVAFTRALAASAPEVWSVAVDGSNAQSLSGTADGTTGTSASNPSWQPVLLQPPAVIDTSPGAGASGVPVTSTITATFDQVLDSFTLTVTRPDRRRGVVAGTVTCNKPCTVVTFTPAPRLARHVTYVAVVTGVNAHGTGTANWTFTTR